MLSSLLRGASLRSKAKQLRPYQSQRDLSMELLEDRIVLTAGVTNLGLASTFQSKLDGNLLAFEVSESGHGGSDLNGDGDASDAVMHVFDSSTGITTNLGLVGGGGLLDGNLLAFAVSESRQGGSDLNGDGDASDFVVHVFDASTAITTNLSLAGDFLLHGNLLAIAVSESDQGSSDLNGDGDASDFVVHVFDASTGTTTNLALDNNGIIALDGNVLAIMVSESSQGNSDLNGDGDTEDFVRHVADLALALSDPTTLIEQLIAEVEALNLQQGIDNSLDAKLDAALNALDDLNENNNVAAIGSITAFINAVEAQRGKKITEADAVALIDDAEAIIELLQV